MIFVTGDCHSDVRRFSVDIFPEQKSMNKEDYVIICGDFGLVWDWKGESRYEKNWLDWLEEKPFTTLFVDGNHENFARLNALPEEEWHGGLVHRVRPSVIHLMRGQVFDVGGAKIFAFGGARSHDISDGILDPEKDKAKIKRWERDYTKLFRVNGRSWWPEEMPSEEERERGRRSLAAVGNKVDFIISHDGPSSDRLLLGFDAGDELSAYLEEIRAAADYTRWFFGHLHENKQAGYRDILVYEQILRIW